MSVLDFLLGIILIHWAFNFGILLAIRTDIKTWQLCFFFVAIKTIIVIYGHI